MAFIERAIREVKAGGAVGTLMPSSILSLEASLRWRRHLLDRATPRYLAVLGDHALFRHALVEVAYAIFIKQVEEADTRIISLWTSEQKGSAGEALRTLRRINISELRNVGAGMPAVSSAEEWRVSITSAESLLEVPDWRPRPNRLGNLLSTLAATTSTRVVDIFHVREGVRAGLRKAFILSPEEYSKLPKREHPYFRPVAENKNIRAGRILSHDYIFYPNTAGLEPVSTEADLQRLVPTYYERYLCPYRPQLSVRVGLAGRDWWLLNRHRTWLAKPEPKIVSTFFGDSGSFAWDASGDYVIVQGFGWLARSVLRQQIDAIPLDVREDFRNQVYYAYLALLNSSIFSLLLGEFCPHVAGGQFNLSKRFVDHIPLPNLAKLSQLNPHTGSMVSALATEGKRIFVDGVSRLAEANDLVADLYGVPLKQWPIRYR